MKGFSSLLPSRKEEREVGWEKEVETGGGGEIMADSTHFLWEMSLPRFVWLLYGGKIASRSLALNQRGSHKKRVFVGGVAFVIVLK